MCFFLEKDIILHQVLQLLSDLVLKHNHILTLAHVFIRWFVCGERKNSDEKIFLLERSSFVLPPLSHPLPHLVPSNLSLPVNVEAVLDVGWICDMFFHSVAAYLPAAGGSDAPF